MKKLFLSIAIVGAALLGSCSAEKKAEDKGADLKAKIENCTNSDSLKVYVQQAKDYADQLIKEGKDEAASAFLDEVTPAVKAKDPLAAGAFIGLDLKAKADSAIDAGKEAAKNLADSVSSKAGEVKDAVGEKAGQVKDAVSDKAKEVKDATKSAVESAKEKTAAAAQAGADKVKEALGK